MKRLERAKISLNDCLACSGCVTSAETVLITQQSHEELEKILADKRNVKILFSSAISSFWYHFICTLS